jgi:steroid delta-isomerase-like uncharacterized protein
MDTRACVAFTQTFVQEVWNHGKAWMIDDMVAEDFENFDPAMITVNTRDDFKEWVRDLHTTFPDFHVHGEDLIAQDNKVVIRWTMTGTHEAEMLEIPPTGKKVILPGTTIYEIDQGRISRMWWFYDMYGLFMELGVITDLRIAEPA